MRPDRSGIPVSDMAKMIRFYRDIPDFKIREAEDTSNKSTGRTAESRKKRTEREGGWNG